MAGACIGLCLLHQSLIQEGSGTTLRLLLGVFSGQRFTSTVNRSEASQKKHVGEMVMPLRQMGANIEVFNERTLGSEQCGDIKYLFIITSLFAVSNLIA